MSAHSLAEATAADLTAMDGPFNDVAGPEQRLQRIMGLIESLKGINIGSQVVPHVRRWRHLRYHHRYYP